MDFKMTFKTNNDAFNPDPSAETARILEATAEKLRRGNCDGRCADINGNTIGEWFLSHYYFNGPK